jgi:glutathione S-transferase
VAEDGFVVTECPAVLSYVSRRFPQARRSRDKCRCAEWLAWRAPSLQQAFGRVRWPDRFADSGEAREEVKDKCCIVIRAVWEMVESKLAEPIDIGRRAPIIPSLMPASSISGSGALVKTLRYDKPRDFREWTRRAKQMAQRTAVRRALAREGLEHRAYSYPSFEGDKTCNFLNEHCLATG